LVLLECWGLWGVRALGFEGASRARRCAENLVRVEEMPRSLRAVRNDGTNHDDGVEAVVFWA